MFLAGITAVYLLFTVLRVLSMAHADGVPVQGPAPAATGVPWDVILLGAIAIFSGIRTILAFVAPRTKTTLDDQALANIDELLNILRGPRVPVPLPSISREGGFVRIGLVSVLAAAALVGVILSSGCAGTPAVRGRVSVGTGAFLECEAPNVSALAQDMVPFVVATIQRWISGTGHPDSTGIRADAAKVKTMAGQCAWDAAMAILTTPQATLAGAPQSSPQAVSVQELRTTWAAVRADLAWAR
jgi:hypothetical protein